jgi:hypothetical protein
MEALDYPDITNKYSLDLSLWLGDYDDIYSDFDSRSYLKRRVSADFINELRSALKNKNEKINDLVLLLPQKKRDTGIEQKITRNLKDHFAFQLHSFTENYSKSLKKGIVLFITATLLMIGNSIVTFQLHNNLLSSIIRIVLEPSGWFLAWISFDMLYYDLQKLRKEKGFFRELTEMQIIFQSSDPYVAVE